MRRLLPELSMLRKIVGDGEPRRLGANEDVRRGADGGLITESAERHMNVPALANQGVQEGAALGASGVMGEFLPEDEQVSGPVHELELLPLDAGEWFEGSTGGAATIGAMAVEGVREVVFDRVLDSTTKALARQQTTTRRRFVHGVHAA
jgi:hypothetical protein